MPSWQRPTSAYWYAHVATDQFTQTKKRDGYMQVLIADIETDGLFHDMTKIHCLAIGDLHGTTTVYADHKGYLPLHEGVDRLRKADRIVMHNGIGFDYPVLERFFGDAFVPLERIYDTLILSRLTNPERGKHSLEDWGESLGFEKYEYSDWSKFTDQMAVYCARDVDVTRKVYEQLCWCDWDRAIDVEHKFAYVISQQERHGFKLNLTKARELEATLRQEQVDIERELQEIFPPKVIKRVSEKTGKPLKDKIEAFNPGSRKQIADRFIEKYGWKPRKFTPAGSPAVDEQVLAGLKFEEASTLLRYMRVSKQLGQVVDGDAAWLKLERNGYVHGKVNTIGAATHRCSHFSPNMAQVDKKDLRMREVWEPDTGHILVGCDAEGLELRCLASYLGRFDGGKYADAVVNGDKSNGTDVHSVTKKLLQMQSRDNAKRVMYAYLYGAGDSKLKSILKEDGAGLQDGAEARKALQKGIKGLNDIVVSVKKRADTGKLKGIDGRMIPIRSAHSALNSLLQSAGAIVMKYALVIFHYDLASKAGYVKNNVATTFKYCANVHDEVQMSVPPEKAEEIGKMFAEAIRLAGEHLDMRCVLAGSYDIGANWKETH